MQKSPYDTTVTKTELVTPITDAAGIGGVDISRLSPRDQKSLTEAVQTLVRVILAIAIPQ
jgi:hypothetical protein